MLIALDIDGTYTEDQQLWHSFIRSAVSRGHEVIVVTMRYPNELNDDYITTLSGFGLSIYTTGRQKKRKFMEDKGIFVDVWIDDMPEAV